MLKTWNNSPLKKKKKKKYIYIILNVELMENTEKN